MTDIMYADFLTSDEAYYQAAQHWRQLFETKLAEFGYSWQSYLNTTTASGAPLRDGNPIFNAYVPEINRALRIIQEAPEEPIDFSSWTSHTEWPDGRPLEEKVICLVRTEETRLMAEEAIEAWLSSEK